MPADPTQYVLRVTAGPSYEASTHQEVYVNTSRPTQISSPKLNAALSVRIQDYRGLPSGSPSTSKYFSTAPHDAHHDRYSIAFAFRLKEDIPGSELVFGNDFAHPIRDNLPYGFGIALKFVRWTLDPGLDGDVYADMPHLYGPLLSSINVLRIGASEEAAEDGDNGNDQIGGDTGVLREGADGEDAQRIRQQAKMPDQGSKRMAFFLDKANRDAFTFEAGRQYSCDFFNPFLDFNDLALKLPVITLPLMRFWDGQPLRYVLKRKSADGSTDEVLMVVVFTLLPKERAESIEAQAVGDTDAGSKGGPDFEESGVD